ncbi:MAG: hypothetical protein IPK74_04525 [Deltaproteobacteria bacterium]|nr:hypothetical protein [Deltaproteobacteria bacterium]
MTYHSGTRIIIALASTLAFIPGCIFTQSSSSGSDGADDGSDGASASASAGDSGELDPGALDECPGDATPAQRRDAVVIAQEYGDSVHEMIACGMLQVALVGAIVEGIVDAIAAGTNDATPDGWSFDDGVYRTAGNGATMETRFYLAQDTSFGHAGDLVEHNLFLVDSYLVGAVLVVDLVDGVSEIQYASHGPLVELMGFGAAPPNPLPVDYTDLEQIQRRLGALDFETRIDLDDRREHATVVYHVDTPRMSAGALLDGEAMVLGLQSATAERSDLGQSLLVDRWDLHFVEHGSLTGTVDTHVEGGPLPFAAQFVWADSGYPEIELACAN